MMIRSNATFQPRMPQCSRNTRFSSQGPCTRVGVLVYPFRWKHWRAEIGSNLWVLLFLFCVCFVTWRLSTPDLFETQTTLETPKFGPEFSCCFIWAQEGGCMCYFWWTCSSELLTVQRTSIDVQLPYHLTVLIICSHFEIWGSNS